MQGPGALDAATLDICAANELWVIAHARATGAPAPSDAAPVAERSGLFDVVRGVIRAATGREAGDAAGPAAAADPHPFLSEQARRRGVDPATHGPTEANVAAMRAGLSGPADAAAALEANIATARAGGAAVPAPVPAGAGEAAAGGPFFFPVSRLSDKQVEDCARAEKQVAYANIALGIDTGIETRTGGTLGWLVNRLSGGAFNDAGAGDPIADSIFFVREQARRARAPLPDFNPSSPGFVSLRRGVRENPVERRYHLGNLAWFAPMRSRCVAMLMAPSSEAAAAAAADPDAAGPVAAARVIHRCVPVAAPGVKVSGPITGRRAPAPTPSE
ncbi:hypothetical protein ACQ5SO_19220 [Rhodovulum sp. DZ06]|uniref:hypothetical protein n=1 Tax=Rhodovulum sp. DZ06 TaxID=3425126 RepID=UPI003D353AE4